MPGYSYSIRRTKSVVPDTDARWRPYLGTYDVALDGQRFLIGELVGETVPPPRWSWTGPAAV